MKYDSINYSDEELSIFNKIKEAEYEFKKYEALSNEEASENVSDPYTSKKSSIKNDIVSYVKRLNEFGVNNTGLADFDDISRCESYSAWYKKIDEQEQIKIYNQLIDLRKKLEEAKKSENESGKKALLSNLQRKFLSSVQKLVNHDIDISELTSSQKAIDAFDSAWDMSQGSNNLQSWHFSVLGIKASWELTKQFNFPTSKKVK